MFRLAQIPSHRFEDAELLVESLCRGSGPVGAVAGELFDPTHGIITTRAPGRLDVMGGIADYSGSLVLQLPIREAALVALQRCPQRVLRIASLGAGEASRTFEMPLSDFEQGGAPIDYAASCAYFRRDESPHWAAYAAGAFLVLMRERGCRFAEGARILISSSVPEGKGVSSSAAIEVAVMQAIAAAFEVAIAPRELALLCQKVENLVVGAPCGVMDQMTAACGEENRLLALLCQPAELAGAVEIPEGFQFFGLDSGVRHAVTGADYSTVRVAAFMGYRMIAELAGLATTSEDGGVHIADPLWNGYLANVTPSAFEQRYAARLPESVSGRDFLQRYTGTTDPVAPVDPERVYPVRAATAHPIYEHFRVCAFLEFLRRAGGQCLESAGELMYQSHASYSSCGLGCQRTDRLVELVRAGGPRQGLYGAKITGGGSGGTVAVLARSGSTGCIQEIAGRYECETGYRPVIFRGSSPGAAVFGQMELLAVR